MARGRRLVDGAIIDDGSSPTRTLLLASLIAVLAVATCPGHDSFTQYLTSAGDHPAGYLSGLSVVAEWLRVSVTAESRSWVVMRIGHFRGHRFLGCFGVWVPLPGLPALDMVTTTVCSSGGSGSAPHEAFVLLCIVGWLLWQVAPGVMARHSICSLRALREGRVWVLLTSNLSHPSPLHLLHNMLQVLHFGPVLHSALGCENLLALLASAALASSVASVAWHGYLSGRRGGASAGSLGASGVVMALVAANAALFPRIVVRMYGVDLSAAGLFVVYTAIDVLSQRDDEGHIDASAHAGGALCGWLLARRLRGPVWF